MITVEYLAIVCHTLPLQEVFELRFAKMPEEPPPPKQPSGPKLKKMRGVSSESSDEGSSDESGSGSESDSESERANQLSYLQKQVGDVSETVLG